MAGQGRRLELLLALVLVAILFWLVMTVFCEMSVPRLRWLILLAFGLPFAISLVVSYLLPEPTVNGLIAFAWGSVAAGASFFVGLLVTGFQDLCSPASSAGSSAGLSVRFILLAIVIAPLVDELTKALGLWRGHPGMTKKGRGIAFALAAALGFGAMEGAIRASPKFGVPASVFDALLIAASILLIAFFHLLWTSSSGYGMARKTPAGWRRAVRLVPFYALAVVLHASYNLFVFTRTQPSIASQLFPRLPPIFTPVGLLLSLFAALAFFAYWLWKAS